MIPQLHILRTSDGNDFPLPSYTSQYHVGLNLMAAVGTPIKINPGERIRVPVGFAVGIPVGFCGQIVSRPELALAHGIIVSDAPHIVHPADREPLFVLLQNISHQQYVLHRGDLIAQLIIMPVVQVCWNEVSAVPIGPKTKEADMIIEKDESVSPPTKQKENPRREKKSIRNRYKKTDEDA